MDKLFFNRLRLIPKGYKRLHLIVSILIPLFLLMIILLNGIKFQKGYRYLILYSFFCYWFGVRIFLWVKDGFEKE